jgi:hypothetical protein
MCSSTHLDVLRSPFLGLAWLLALALNLLRVLLLLLLLLPLFDVGLLMRMSLGKCHPVGSY